MKKNKLPVLRQHQKDALEAIRPFIRKGGGDGRIVLPTGTGKSRLEAEVICAIIKHYEKLNEWPGVSVVLAPRILLCHQHQEEFSTFIGLNGIDAMYYNCHSGGINSEKHEKKILKMGYEATEIGSSTNQEKIVKAMEQAKADNKPLVIFSTYHSVGQVDAAATTAGVKIRAYIFDEAQYCVSNGDFQNVPYFDSDFKFYFTATERHTDSDAGLGMNNEEKFGKLIFTEKPRTLVERGEMASVAIHLVGTRGQIIPDSDYESTAKAVTDAFDMHRKVLKETSFIPELIAPKMIVVCDSQESLKGIMASKALKDYKATLVNDETGKSAINICALSSLYGIEINGVYDPRVTNKGKEALLTKLRSLKPEDEAIILHVDMVSEGLDVPGITGIMPFRNLGLIKFLQNVGRGTRLIAPDRERLYDETLKPKDFKKYVKPFCWIILPTLSAESFDAKRRYSNWVCALRADYGFNSTELTVVDNIVGAPEYDEPDDMVGGVQRQFKLGAGAIKEIVHVIEEREITRQLFETKYNFANLNEASQIEMIRRIFS